MKKDVLKILVIYSVLAIINCIPCTNTMGQILGNCDCACGTEDPDFPDSLNCLPCTPPGDRPSGY